MAERPVRAVDDQPGTPGGGSVLGGQKVMTLRISSEHHAALVCIAGLRGTSVTAEVREAIGAYIARRRRDPKFQQRLREYRAKQDAIYESLTAS